jgi:hypothetical protein
MNRHGVGNSGAGVEGNQIHFAGNVFDPGRDLAGMFRSVIHAFEQNLFECETLARTSCDAYEFASRIEQCLDVPLARNGHDALANLIVGSI